MSDEHDFDAPFGNADGGKSSHFNWGMVIGLLLLAVLLVSGFTVGYVWTFLSGPGSLPARDVEVVIMPNTTFGQVSHDLQSKGVVVDSRRFTLLARWQKQTGAIRSGRFLVNTGWTPDMVLDQLVNGAPVLERVTVPEGLTWWETGKRLEEAGLLRFDDFKTVVHDPEFLRYWGIPLNSAEGFLFPDTYLIMRPLELDLASAKTVVGRMIDNFWRRSAPVWNTEGRPGPKDRQRVAIMVNLAAIVEKETAVAAERSRVAGVYANRLRINMPLQADPTIIYGLGPSFSGNIRRKDLNDAENVYNTYRHNGLPPGPICSPGLAALRAAVAPEEHPYMYFVARGDGSHQFSATLAEHNRAVRMYILNKDDDK